MNDAYESIVVWVTAAVEPIVIFLHLLINLSEKFQIMTLLKHSIGSDGTQGRMREGTSLWLSPEPGAIVAPIITVRNHPCVGPIHDLTRSQTQQFLLRLLWVDPTPDNCMET